MPLLAASVLALAVGACQQPVELHRRAPVLDTRFEPTAARSWLPSPKVAPDLDEAQALARAVRTVLQALPEDEQQRILESWLPSNLAPASPRPKLELLTLVRALHARHGTRVLTLSAFFLGPVPMERARKRLRLAPERIRVGMLSRVLQRRERPLLRHVREAERWTTLYALGWPVDRGWHVTSRFGPRIHPILGGHSRHRGIDISMPVGTEVRAPASGIVTRVRQGPINGRWIELDHGAGVRTHYCHLSLVEVKRGQRVKAGDLVARSGNTGRVTGPHLHYQVKLPGGFVDPLGSRAPVPLTFESQTSGTAPRSTVLLFSPFGNLAHGATGSSPSP